MSIKFSSWLRCASFDWTEPPQTAVWVCQIHPHAAPDPVLKLVLTRFIPVLNPSPLRQEAGSEARLDLCAATPNRGGPVLPAEAVQSGPRSGEGNFPSLCVRAQFTWADHQHPGRLHPVQSHLRVQAEPGHDVFQVSSGLLPSL